MSVRTSLDAALAAIRTDQPVLAQRLGAGLGAHTVHVELPHESFIVTSRGSDVVTATTVESPTVRATTTPATLREILAGHVSLHDALVSDAVVLIAPIDIVLHLEEALGLFVNAAVRSPSIIPIYRRFMQEADLGEPTTGWR
jgi:hypothetical protein